MADRSEALHFSVAVGRLAREGASVRYEADAAALERLARQLGIKAVTALEAEVLVTPWRGDGVTISGRVRASLTQSCVVSLEPVGQEIDEAVEANFVPQSPRAGRFAGRAGREVIVDPEGEEPPESFAGDRLELGATLSEIVALALDPYPRAERARYEPLDTDPHPDRSNISPFAALKRFGDGSEPG